MLNGVSALVIAGVHDRTIVEVNQQRRTVAAAGIRIHASYNPQTLINDVANLILPTPLEFNAVVQPITRATGTELFVGETATISGFGRISDGSVATSAVVRWTTMPVITNAACGAVFGIITPSNICTSTVGGRSGCNGDSGGPLAVQRDVVHC